MKYSLCEKKSVEYHEHDVLGKASVLLNQFPDNILYYKYQWRRQRGPGGHAPIPEKNWMVRNGGPITAWQSDSEITGSLIQRVTKYSGFQDGCVRISFPVLPFHK